MKVGILFSGGKDSTYAVDYALKKGWDVRYLLSVKPTRTDCYLFHFATVEHTPLLAEQLKIPHKIVSCDVADPEMEAAIVKGEVENLPGVDAVILGGTGLQGQQIRSVHDALRPLGIDVFAAHSGLEHDEVMKEMLDRGYKFIITQIAADGLTADHLGHMITGDNWQALVERSRKFGFHCGGEGGHFDTFTLAGPIFNRELRVESSYKSMESECVGHLVLDKVGIIPVKTVEH